MARGFLAHQLAEVETELTDAARQADALSLDVGDHSDQIHWDGREGLTAAHWIDEVLTIQRRLARAEGLLRAYELARRANLGETDDDTCAR
jgi:hypothetical protein